MQCGFHDDDNNAVYMTKPYITSKLVLLIMMQKRISSRLPEQQLENVHYHYTYHLNMINPTPSGLTRLHPKALFFRVKCTISLGTESDCTLYSYRIIITMTLVCVHFLMVLLLSSCFSLQQKPQRRPNATCDNRRT